LFPAIATGVGTVLADDPRLTARRPGEPEWCGRRLVLDPRGASGHRLDAQVYSDAFRDRTVVVTGPECPDAMMDRFRVAGVATWQLPAGPTRAGRIDLAALRRRCWEEGLTAVYWEPGPRLFGDLLAQGQADYAFHYQAPLWWGDAEARPLAEGPPAATPDSGWRFETVRRELLGDDQLTRGWLRRRSG
jgi:diaminohydroxyphosphoribosylaminopyrimidine deaminase / 5-amino-6-(5-phosphoribosylamino)uracil reductase